MLFKTQIFLSVTVAAKPNVNFLQCSMLIPGDHSLFSLCCVIVWRASLLYLISVFITMLQNKCVCVYINIYTFPFIISIKLNGDVDRYLTDIAEAKRNELNTSGFVACVVREMAALVSKVTVSGWWVLGGLSAALTSCIREIEREKRCSSVICSDAGQHHEDRKQGEILREVLGDY